jgi:hypothetical protein
MVEALKRTQRFNSKYMLPWPLHLKLVPCSKVEASLIPLTTSPPELDHHETADLGVRDTLRVWKLKILEPEPERSKSS